MDIIDFNEIKENKKPQDTDYFQKALERKAQKDQELKERLRKEHNERILRSMPKKSINTLNKFKVHTSNEIKRLQVIDTCIENIENIGKKLEAQKEEDKK